MKSIATMAGMLAVASLALGSPPEIPNTPAAVDDLVYARPFTLDKGFKFMWCQERPTVTSGTLLVLKVDKALVVPRAIAMPVLYVGDRPAERINHGHESGHVIALVPGKVDLSQVPIWFGTPNLPDQVDGSTAKAERALAENAGFKPFPTETVKAALATGGKPIKTVDKSALLRDQVAELILKYSPQEKHLAEAFRVPVLKRPEKATRTDASED